jgi:hypothetical protein
LTVGQDQLVEQEVTGGCPSVATGASAWHVDIAEALGRLSREAPDVLR